MKYFVLTVLIATALIAQAKRCKKDYLADYKTPAVREEVLKNEVCEKCMEKYDVDFESLEDFESPKHETPSNNTKCYYYCYMETVGDFDKNGNLQFDAIEKQTDEKTMELVKECAEKTPKGDDLCDFSYNFVMCIKDQYD